jgi:hypothetical protein
MFNFAQFINSSQKTWPNAQGLRGCRRRNPHRACSLPLDKTNAISGVFQEETMKIRTIALAAVVALSTSSMAFARHHHHHHHMHGMTMGMGSSTGPSGPGLEAGRRDESRVGGRGVSTKPGD